jgi:hypothetical protein
VIIEKDALNIIASAKRFVFQHGGFHPRAMLGHGLIPSDRILSQRKALVNEQITG